MTSANYTKDTTKFWQKREKARNNLDSKRASVSYSEKVSIAGRLQSDAKFLKTGHIVSPKSSPKPSET